MICIAIIYYDVFHEQRIYSGVKQKITTHSVSWTHPITREPRRLELTHTRDYLHEGSDHLEIRSIKPGRAPHPLSETGYHSHFMDAAELKAAGGAVKFVTGWLDREARSKVFIQAEQKRLQGSLFDWAEAQTAMTTKAKASKRPGGNRLARPAAGPQRRPR